MLIDRFRPGRLRLAVRAACGWAVCLIGSMPGAAAAEPDWRQLANRLESGTLAWGGDAEGGAPFELRDPRDPQRVIGFEVEVADALAEVLSRRMARPLRAQFVQYEWPSLPLGLLKGDFDVIISGFEVSEQRRAELALSRPYYIFSQQLVVRRDERAINSLKDCGDKLVGTLSGSAAEAILNSRGLESVSFDGQVEPYLDLELGRLDAVLLDTPIVTYYGATNPKLKLTGPPLGQGAYALAARPDDLNLVVAIDSGLSELMVSGRLQAIYRRWHLWNTDQAALAAGPRRREELRGLGFDPQGTPLADAGQPAEAVDVNIVAASAQLWTIDQYAPLLLRAAGVTVGLTVTSMVLAMMLGLLVAVCRLYGPLPMRWAALGYVEFFRGIPLLMVLFFLYFGLAAYGLEMPAIVAAVIGFGLNYAAYEAEIYRSAILSVPSRQWEAARALGMSEPQTFRRIIFPQALRTALGPMTNDAVALFKDTSLVSVIAVRELTKEYMILSRSSLKFVEIGLLTAALYLAMSVPLGYLSRWLENKWGAAR